MVIEILQAGTGDSIWVSHNKKNIVIDGGKSTAAIRAKYSKMPQDEIIDLLVVTHIDSDHIAGIIALVKHMKEIGETHRLKQVWFNFHKKEETDAAQKDVAETDRIQEKEGKGLPLDEDGYLTGSTGCGLCALYRMKQVGITHLKLVGRGNYTDFMEKDIRQLRKALDILEKSDNELQYQREMKASLFPDGCSQNCYYR